MPSITRILCPVDFSEFSRHAFDHAAATACRYRATVSVLHIVAGRPGVGLPVLVPEEPERDRLAADLKQFTAPAAPLVPLEWSIEEAVDVPRAILAAAARLPADLIVLGSHGRTGFRRLALGSVAERVIRRTPCPALVVPRRAPDAAVEPVRFRELLCAIDFSPASLRALAYAQGLAADAGAHLTALHVIDVPPELHAHVQPPQEIDVGMVRRMAEAGAVEALRRIVADAPAATRVRTEVREGDAAWAIVRAAAEHCADLIVMGAQGRGAIDLLVFGSNTAKVTRTVSCPVLVVPDASETHANAPAGDIREAV
jgi:nucleotide-binding universal stress UspA family protein